MIGSVQDAVNALERGIPLTLYDDSTLVKHVTGEYVWTPNPPASIVVQTDNRLSSLDLESLLLTVLLRDAEITPTVIESRIVEAHHARKV